MIHERCQWSTDSIVSVHVHRLITAVNYIYTPKIVNLQCEMAAHATCNPLLFLRRCEVGATRMKSMAENSSM